MWKKIILIILLLTVGTIAYVGYQNYPKLEIVSSYAAKKMCSCTFIADRSQESIQNEDLGMSPLSLSKTVIDRANKRVTTSVFGMQSKTAEFRGKLGCVLVQGKDDYNVKFPENNLAAVSLPDTPFPYGNKMNVSVVNGVNYEKLAKVASQAFDPNGEMTNKKTRSLLILHKDSILLEQYAQGYNENTEVIGWSMTKSIMNTWVGMMVKDSIVKLSDKALFDDWQNDERKQITLNDLMQMQSGLEWEEVYSEISAATKMLYASEDNAAVAMSQPLEFEPGTHWEYSSGTTNLISKYMRDQFKNHDDYLRFPYERIFQKLNMDNTILEVDESGTYIGSSYCYATTRDWARFGTLYLRDGVWNGERLLPEGWIDYTKTPAKSSNGEYGAQFWLNEDSKYYKDAPSDMYAANGYEGQRVFIIPSKDIVIVRMGLSQNFDFNGMLKGILESIEN